MVVQLMGPSGSLLRFQNSPMGMSLIPSHCRASIQCEKNGPPDSGCVPRRPAPEGQFAESAVVIRRHQVRRRAAVVGQKLLRGLRIVHRPSEQGGQVEERIVASRRLRNSSRIFGVQVGWPSSQLSMWKYWSVLPTSGPASAISFAPVCGKMGVHGLGAHRVDLQAGRSGTDALDHVAVQGVAECAGSCQLPAGTSQSVVRFGPRTSRQVHRLDYAPIARANRRPARRSSIPRQEAQSRPPARSMTIAVIGIRRTEDRMRNCRARVSSKCEGLSPRAAGDRARSSGRKVCPSSEH